MSSYGDLSPKSQMGRGFAFLVIPMGVGVVAHSIFNFIVSTVHERLKNKVLDKNDAEACLML